MAEPERPQMAIWRMRIACVIPTATNTHLEYVVLTTFPRQKWLHECASVLRYAYIVLCLYSFFLSLFRFYIQFSLLHLLLTSNMQLNFLLYRCQQHAAVHSAW